MTPAQLAAALRHQAHGIYCLEAAAELLIAQAWPHRADFTSQFTTAGPVSAVIDWSATIASLDAGDLPCSGGERRMLMITASLADGIPVDLQDAISGIDHRNVQLVVRAMLHASGQRPQTVEP